MSNYKPQYKIESMCMSVTFLAEHLFIACKPLDGTKVHHAKFRYSQRGNADNFVNS